MKKFNAKFPISQYMSPISYIVIPTAMETKEEQALWNYNNSRNHDGLAPLRKLPNGVVFTEIHS